MRRWWLGAVVCLGLGCAEDKAACRDGYVRGESGRCEPIEEPEPDCVDDGTADRRMWRLTREEYLRTMTDLMGLESTFDGSVASDVYIEGFSTDSDALKVSLLLSHQYRVNAESLSNDADLDLLLPCEPDTAGAAACAAEFIESFGLRVFRRPLQEEEVERYLTLWSDAADTDGFEEGIRWVINALLQSPNFLYRSELGVLGEDERYALTDWEIASELSYLMWGTMPDDTLFAAAESGILNTDDQIASHVDRMRRDARFLDTAADFVEVWLHLARLQTVSRDGLTAELRASMTQETRTLSREVAWVDGSLSDLMLSPYTKMDETLAEHHGISATGWVEVGSIRDEGLLAHAGVLTTYALPTSSSPVHRGAMVRRYLLCEELLLPPPEVQAAPPEPDPDLTTRDAYADHMTKSECSVCHELIDPIGFGFEHYDGLGRWRDLEEGLTVDATGQVDDVTFDGLGELTLTLLDDERFRTCFAWNWKRWKTGSETCATDPGEVGFTAPLLDLVEREAFTLREGETSEGDTLAQGRRLSPDVLDALAAEIDDTATDSTRRARSGM